MARIFKSYEEPFVIDEAKLRRIKGILDDKLGAPETTLRYKFDINTISSRHYTFSDIDELFHLDNSNKERVQDVFLICTLVKDGAAPDEEKKEIEVHFHGDSETKMCLDIMHEQKMANELYSLLEEQVDRAKQSGLMSRISYLNRKWYGFVWALNILFVALLLYLLLRGSPNNLPSLTPSDVGQVNNFLSNSSLTDSQKADRIILVLAERIAANYETQNRGIMQRLLTDWTTWFLISPPIIIGASLIYLIQVCYPSAVIIWGDAKDWFSALIGRRRAIWSLIIISIVMGVLGNLFVVGLERLTR